jgi:hypothetical protein
LPIESTDRIIDVGAFATHVTWSSTENTHAARFTFVAINRPVRSAHWRIKIWAVTVALLTATPTFVKDIVFTRSTLESDIIAFFTFGDVPDPFRWIATVNVLKDAAAATLVSIKVCIWRTVVIDVVTCFAEFNVEDIARRIFAGGIITTEVLSC